MYLRVIALIEALGHAFYNNSASVIADQQLFPVCVRIRNYPAENPFGKIFSLFFVIAQLVTHSSEKICSAGNIYPVAGLFCSSQIIKELIKEAVENAKVIELPETDYELLSEADVEKMVAEEAKKNGGNK